MTILSFSLKLLSLTAERVTLLSEVRTKSVCIRSLREVACTDKHHIPQFFGKGSKPSPPLQSHFDCGNKTDLCVICKGTDTQH